MRAHSDEPMVELRRVGKCFTLHTQGSVELTAFAGVDLSVCAGECVAVDGPSGSGKSTLLRLIYGNYHGQSGSIRVRHDGGLVELIGADPRIVLTLRQRTLGYVSQFLRALPRVAAIDVVAEPMVAAGIDNDLARTRARHLLARLNLPARLWSLPPTTFSGGEQQRVNLARGFAVGYPILLLDEPTASLDAQNRSVVVELIGEARARGAAVLGAFHDRDVREAVADRVFTLAPIEAAA